MSYCKELFGRAPSCARVGLYAKSFFKAFKVAVEFAFSSRSFEKKDTAPIPHAEKHEA